MKEMMRPDKILETFTPFTSSKVQQKIKKYYGPYDDMINRSIGM